MLMTLSMGTSANHPDYFNRPSGGWRIGVYRGSETYLAWQRPGCVETGHNFCHIVGSSLANWRNNFMSRPTESLT